MTNITVKQITLIAAPSKYAIILDVNGSEVEYEMRVGGDKILFLDAERRFQVDFLTTLEEAQKIARVVIDVHRGRSVPLPFRI